MADRAEYERRQAELLGALQGRRAVPAGFAADDVEAARAALARKRSASIRAAWPALWQGLGESADSLFLRFAAEVGPPPAGDAAADGYAFARWLGRARLSEQARVELALAEARRRPYAAVVALSRPRRLFVVLSAGRRGGLHFTLGQPA